MSQDKPAGLNAAHPARVPPQSLPGVLSRYAARSGGRLTPICEGWVWALERRGRRIVIFGYDLGLNAATTEKLCRDKAAMAALLTQDGVSTPPALLMLHPGFRHIRAPEAVLDDVRRAFADFGGDVVIKPNEGTGGRRVLRAQTPAAAEDAAAEIFALEQNALVQPFIDATREWRLYLLDGRVKIGIEKTRGGGENWRGNLGLGATGRAAIISPEIAEIALAAAAALDLRFGSLDILDGADGPVILEANNGVMLENFSRLGPREAALAEDLYARALDSRFAQAGD